jgi:hypothetical protein
MSSTLASSPSPAIDPRRLHYPLPDPPQEEASYIHPTQKDSSTLSPYSGHHPYSTSVSPSDFDTPSDQDLYSEYVEFNVDDPNDPFYGVDFDPGAEAAHASPATLVDLPITTTDVSTIEALLPESQPPKASSEFVPAYPVSPLNTSSANTRNALESTSESMQMTQSHYSHSHGLSIPNHSIQYKMASTPSSLHPLSDQSSSSHNSAEGISPAMIASSYSPRVTITPAWAEGEEQDLSVHDSYMTGGGGYHGVQNGASLYGFKVEDEDTSTAVPHIPSYGTHDEDWDSDEINIRSGVKPERRKSLSAVEVPNFKDLENNEALETKKRDVADWMSKASESVVKEEVGPTTNLSAPNLGTRRRAKSTSAAFVTPSPLGQNGEDPAFPEFRPTPQQSFDPVEGEDIEAASDTMSIRENRLQEGQLYYNVHAKEFNPRDISLVMRPRYLHDAPQFPKISDTCSQPQSSNEAMKRWNQTADTFSLLSRQATWGTRRKSEPSLADIESIKNGSFIKRLSFGREKREKKPGGYFEKGLDQITNLVRKKSDANQLKRSRSGKDPKESRGRTGAPSNLRKESQASLAPPRSPSSNRRRPESPRLNTNVGGSPGALGRTYSGSISATSPNSTNKNAFGFVGAAIRRARSRSDIRQGPGEGLATMWRGVGGPPLPTLASPPIDNNEDIKPIDLSDVEADDDDDEEGGEEGDRIEFDQMATPISPNFAGFKDHVLRLNPTMEAEYLVDRIAHQQVVRYKNLLNWRVKHSAAIINQSCTANHHCLAQGGAPTLLDPKGQPRKTSISNGLQGAGDLSDGDSNPEGQLAMDSFPNGVPMPPATSLPAEFECQLCFRVKKFQKPSDWTKHVHEDVQPFTCTYSACREPKSFKRKADWVRHENERHRHLEWWMCQVDDCSHKCYRKDNFLQHLVREHKLPEPKAKTKAAVKKARGSDEQVWVMVRSCHHETKAQPQDEPCKFCGKVLTSWKKLTVHLAKHMEHISLPVLRLVEQQSVDANTIISPVEPLPSRPSPLTPTNMGRELSGSSGPFTIGSSISPNTAHLPQFQSPNYPQHSPHGSNMPIFTDPLYGPTMGFVANTSGPINYAIHAPVQQQQHQSDLLFGNNQLGFNGYDQLNPGMHHGHSATRSQGGFTSIDNSPLIDDTHGFTTLNQGQGQNYNASTSSRSYNSYPNSNHTLSPDPSFVPISAPQQMNGPGAYSTQSLTPDSGNFAPAPQQLSGRGYSSFDGLGLGDPNAFGFHGVNIVGDGSGINYTGQIAIGNRSNGNMNGNVNGGGNSRNHSGSASFSSSPHGRNGSGAGFGGRTSNAEFDAGQNGYAYQ